MEVTCDAFVVTMVSLTAYILVTRSASQVAPSIHLMIKVPHIRHITNFLYFTFISVEALSFAPVPQNALHS